METAATLGRGFFDALGAVGGGGAAGEAGEAAVELGEGLEADFEGDVGDACGGAEEFAFGPGDAATGDVFGEGEASDFFEDAAEVGFGEAGVSGHDGEGEGFAEVGVDELAGFGDGFGLASVLCGGEVVGVAAELFAEAGEKGDHALVTLGADRSGLEVGLFEGVDVVGDESTFGEGFKNAVEVVFIRSALEDLAGFQEGDGIRAERDGDRGGGHAGEATARGGAFRFGVIHQLSVDGDAGLAGGVAEIEFLAEGALVFEVLGEAPLFVDADEAKGKTGGVAEGVLVGLIKIGLGQTVEDPLLVDL